MSDKPNATTHRPYTPPRLLANLDKLEWEGTQYLLPVWLRDELVNYLNGQLSGGTQWRLDRP